MTESQKAIMAEKLKEVYKTYLSFLEDPEAPEADYFTAVFLESSDPNRQPGDLYFSFNNSVKMIDSHDSCSCTQIINRKDLI